MMMQWMRLQMMLIHSFVALRVFSVQQGWCVQVYGYQPNQGSIGIEVQGYDEHSQCWTEIQRMLHHGVGVQQ
jgi:hypothetical protein